MEFLKNRKDFFQDLRLDIALNEMLCDARKFADEIDIPANFELIQPRQRVRRRNVNFDYEALENPTLKYKAEFYFFTLHKTINALEFRVRGAPLCLSALVESTAYPIDSYATDLMPFMGCRSSSILFFLKPGISPPLPQKQAFISKETMKGEQYKSIDAPRALAPFTWTKIAGNMPERIRFVPVYTATRQIASSKCRSIFCTLFRLGTLGVKRRVFSNSPEIHLFKIAAVLDCSR
ncbi:uncharacterized protein TNCV_4053071 [Trichonephila clavipes]|nr:uncharacterized protein TNCV_4053071 [Trichonephila clavipes]